MKKFEVHTELADARAIVKGTFSELYPGDKIIVTKGGREWDAIVETRFSGGASVRVVLER